MTTQELISTQYHLAKLYPIGKKFKILWLLLKYSFFLNKEVSIDIHPSGSYQVWIDTNNF